MAERFNEDEDEERSSTGRSQHKKKKKEHKKDKNKDKKKKDKKEHKKSKKRSSHKAEDEKGERKSAKRVKRGDREDSSSGPPDNEIIAARRRQDDDDDEGGGATHDDGSGGDGGGIIKAPPRPLVESSALPQGKNDDDDDDDDDNDDEPAASSTTITLLLFYQYVEPAWSDSFYQTALRQVKRLAEIGSLTGRCRVAKEGLNCTLSGPKNAVRTFCYQLRYWQPTTFHTTEFKLTHDVPIAQRFRELKILPVTELVHYGLEGRKAPPLLPSMNDNTHLEPAAYHAKLAEPDTVVIDVRNHYEAAIGHFIIPPSSSDNSGGATYIDPKMRKSTEFPVWLDDPMTHEKLRNKQVLMYCTGGIRCERASALLRYKMEHDPDVRDLNIRAVYQLQGGVDKYFKVYPDGGDYWRGKNYTFDKRFAHEPTAMMMMNNTDQQAKQQQPAQQPQQQQQQGPIGQCEACHKPWDRYRGKRRCPTCGVPSLICKDCHDKDQNGDRKLDQTIRCDLCVEQNVYSKATIRQRQATALQQYEARQRQKGLLEPAAVVVTTITGGGTPEEDGAPPQPAPPPEAADNPDQITRLYLKNMCRKTMTDEVLLECFPSITHIVWNTRKGTFLGQGWVEMESPHAAAQAVARSGETILGRPIYIDYQPADAKDLWPPPKSAVRY